MTLKIRKCNSFFNHINFEDSNNIIDSEDLCWKRKDCFHYTFSQILTLYKVTLSRTNLAFTRDIRTFVLQLKIWLVLIIWKIKKITSPLSGYCCMKKNINRNHLVIHCTMWTLQLPASRKLTLDKSIVAWARIWCLTNASNNCGSFLLLAVLFWHITLFIRVVSSLITIQSIE